MKKSPNLPSSRPPISCRCGRADLDLADLDLDFSLWKQESLRPSSGVLGPALPACKSQMLNFQELCESVVKQPLLKIKLGKFSAHLEGERQFSQPPGRGRCERMASLERAPGPRRAPAPVCVQRRCGPEAERAPSRISGKALEAGRACVGVGKWE